MAQCTGRNKDGNRCNNNAMVGRTTCYLKAHGASATLGARLANFITNNKLAICFLAFISVAGFLLAVWQEHEAHQNARLNATSGALTARQSNIWKVIILGGGTPLAFNSPDGVLLRDGDAPLLSARQSKDGHVLFSFSIRDVSGKLIAEINDNEWSLQPSQYFARNYTDHMLEVRDAYGRVVLQAVDLGNGAFYIAGMFRCRNGNSWYFSSLPGGKGIWQPLYPTETPSDAPLNALCKYPSDRHLGECADEQSISQWNENDPASQAHFVTKSLDFCNDPQPALNK